LAGLLFERWYKQRLEEMRQDAIFRLVNERRALTVVYKYRVLILLGAIALLFGLYVAGLSKNPPGFYLDESSIAYNAYTVSRSGTSQFGVRWPLFFQFDREGINLYNPPYVYLLAGVFFLFSPGILLARLLSAALGFAAALLLGLLALRISRQRTIGIIVALTALLTPWLFEVSRLVFEAALYPLAVVLFLLVLYHAHSKGRWSLLDSTMLALTLALLTYTYTAGRLLGPLLAFGLLLFASSKQRLTDVIKTWTAYGITLLPLFVFNRRYPGALLGRFHSVTYITRDRTQFETAVELTKHLLANLNLVSWLLIGDPKPRHHVPGSMGSIFAATVILAAIGFVLVLRRQWRNPWWRFVLFGLGVSILPGALTIEDFHTLRLIAYPVFFLVLTIPALAWLLEVSEKDSSECERRKTLRTRNPNHISVALVLAIVLLGLAWIAVAKFAIPAMIASAYRGESWPILNRMIRGQASHPLAEYLVRWAQLKWTILQFSFVVGLLIVWIARPEFPAAFWRPPARHSGLAHAVRRATLAVLLVLTVAQAAYFQVKFRRDGPKRGSAFEAEFQEIFAAATAFPTRPIYVIGQAASTNAYWYSTLQTGSTSGFMELPTNAGPPGNSLVITSDQECINCRIILKRGRYILYRSL
jgi:4-amino-4-deoxy-L-arabinose transferase-like glycosyltransferase